MGDCNEARYYPSYNHWLSQANDFGYPSVDKAILNLYLQQIPLSSISRMFLTRNGVIRKHLNRLLPQENRFYKRYQKLYLQVTTAGYRSVNQFLIDHQDMTPSTIAKQLGIHVATVRNHFHRLGLHVNPPGGANNPKGGKFKHYYQGIPLKQWCQQTGHDYGYIMHRINRGWNLTNAIHIPKQKRGRPR